VAQVFLEDAAWIQALRGIRGALAADGLLVFETRDPARAAWRGCGGRRSGPPGPSKRPGPAR
jgi:hypothetical protein